MQIDITPLVQAIVTLIGIVITMYVIPMLRLKLSIEEQERINEWVRIAVYAAEQLGGKTPGNGENKKNYVVSTIRDLAAKHGLEIDMLELDAIIEATVLEMNKGLF